MFYGAPDGCHISLLLSLINDKSWCCLLQKVTYPYQESKFHDLDKHFLVHIKESPSKVMFSSPNWWFVRLVIRISKWWLISDKGLKLILQIAWTNFSFIETDINRKSVMESCLVNNTVYVTWRAIYQSDFQSAGKYHHS